MFRRVESHSVPTTIDDYTQRWAGDLGRAEADRHGLPLPVACRTVARRLGLPSSSVDNLRRGRIKSVSAYVADKIRGAIIAKIHAEMQALQYELEIATRAASHPADVEILEAQAALAAARSLLSGLSKRSPVDPAPEVQR